MDRDNEQLEQDVEAALPDAETSDDLAVSCAEPRATNWLMLLVPIAMVCIGGTKSPWASGAFAMLVGICLLIVKPRYALPAGVLIPLFGLFATLASSLLPVSPASLPEWRSILTSGYTIDLSNLRSPQPWVTVESLLFTFVGAAWLVCCIVRGYRTRERQFYLTAVPVLIALIACAALYVRKHGIDIPMWKGPWKLVYFGPFPNRNHFATLLAIGGVLGFASTYAAFRRHSGSWMLLAMAIVPIFAALLLNTSRAGIILFFGGLGAWMLVAGFRKRSGQLLAVLASVLLVLASGFIVFGRNIIDRFAERSVHGNSSSLISRLDLYKEVVRLAQNHLILGVGMGNFEPVFALNKSVTDHLTRNFHPESDFFWLFFEGGGVAVLLVSASGIALLRRMGPCFSKDSKGRKERRLRNSAGVASLLAVTHSLVDTPLHTLGLWSLTCLLLGLALRSSRLKEAQGIFTPLVCRGSGLLCCAIGTLWMLGAAGHWFAPGASSSAALASNAANLVELRDFKSAVAALDKAIAMTPLNYSLYFQRAAINLELGRSPQEALTDFARARALEPHSALLCFEESQIWLKHFPLYAIPAIREAMTRDNSRSYGSWGFYTRTLPAMQSFPELRQPLLELATTPKLKISYMENAATPADFQTALQSLLTESPDLRTLADTEKRKLFRLWYARGDKAPLIAFLEKDVDSRSDGWFYLADDKATKGDFQGAYQLAIDFLPPPPETENQHYNDLSQLRKDFLFNPTDVIRGLRLASALRSKGMWDEALTVLDKLAGLPDAPRMIPYEQALIHARRNEYQRAWDRLRAYMAVVSSEP